MKPVEHACNPATLAPSQAMTSARTTGRTTAPDDGDVIARSDHSTGTSRYVLRIAPGPDQLIMKTADAATAHAAAFAALHHVRAWLADTGGSFVLLEDCRAETPSTPSARATPRLVPQRVGGLGLGVPV